MYNPRYPHKLRVIMKSLDTNGLPVTDDNGDPVEFVMPIKKVVTNKDGDPTFNDDGTMKTVMVKELEFGYRTATGNVRKSGDVIVCDYMLACPMFKTYVPNGTILELTDYIRTFRVAVVKQNTNNFGANFWVDEVRN